MQYAVHTPDRGSRFPALYAVTSPERVEALDHVRAGDGSLEMAKRTVRDTMVITVSSLDGIAAAADQPAVV